MRTKRVLWSLGKVFAAGCTALAVLTGICLFYYNIPTHFPSPDGATDYRWEPDTFYSRGTEGFAWGKTNNEGYVNLVDYRPGMPVQVLVMGSSHMEAYHVPPEESTASRLNARLGGESVYSIGVSGHTLPTCLCNLAAAVEKYRPSAYVVLETGTLFFSEANLEAALNGSLAEIPSHAGGLVGLLQQNQFLRLCYAQLKGFLGQGGQDSEAEASPDSAPAASARTADLLDALLGRAAETAASSGAKIILLYQPSTQLSPEGQLLTPEDGEQRALFSSLCEKNGLLFLDMTKRFHEEYESRHILPHGFINSSVGSGHLNSAGHAMIAEELYKLIEEGA